MAGIRELRSRIRSTNSIKKITKAQELIATSRITKAQARVEAARPYSRMITVTLTELASGSPRLDHPLLTERATPKRAGILVVTSDSGQCGAYNANVLRETEELQQLIRQRGLEPVVFVMGRKGLGYYTFRDREIGGSWTGFSQAPTYADAAKASRLLVKLFMAGADEQVTIEDGHTLAGIDELHIVFTTFVSMLSQQPTVRRVAPLSIEYRDEIVELGEDMLADGPKAGEVTAQYEFEPDATTLLGSLLPKYVGTRIYAALLDAAASESAARRTAMKAATDNANDLVNSLTREANQLRQAQITQEISEIVGGVDALAASAGSD